MDVRENGQRTLAKLFRRNLYGTAILLLGMVSGLSPAGLGQSNEVLPFELSNPTHKKWSPEEAIRIYTSACNLVARNIRPERPPHLHPRFLLVLGAADNQVVRNEGVAEVHLKSWDPDKFSEAVVILVAREVLQPDDLRHIALESVRSALATASVEELRKDR